MYLTVAFDLRDRGRKLGVAEENNADAGLISADS
jgi:hypothetical protein